MSSPNKAVFLSYASQDAEAAKKICEALRAAGVEVWFDQSELVGGDAWDAKIRKQIKECALLIPVISAAAQARREGYFRLEWRLADQRTHLMARGLPFLLPVVIDDTRDAEAHVPDSFTEVQWTRLPGGETPPAFAARVKKLLGAEMEAGRPRPAERDEGVASPRRTKSKPVWLWVLLALVVAVPAYFIFKSRRSPEEVARLISPAQAMAASANKAALAPGEGSQLAARALAITEKLGFTREELAVAEDLARRATELEPDSAGAWGVRAAVQMSWMIRNWDNSEKRRQEVQAMANRALALDPNEPEALLAIGHLLRKQGAFEQAAIHLRRAVAANPEHIPLIRALGFSLRLAGHEEECRAMLQAATLRAPRDPLLRYDLAMSYADFGPGGADPANLAESIKQLDAAQAIQPFSTALIVKAVLLAGWRGDFAGMRAILHQLDQMSLTVRSEDRSVCVAMWAGLIEHRSDRVEAAALLTARDYFEDRLVPMRPKAWSLAQAHRLAGKEVLARSDWQAAETMLRARLREDPANEIFKAELAITLAWLDQRVEGARLIGEMEPLWREQPTPARQRLLALYYAALGDAAKAAPYLTTALDGDVFTTRHTVPLDPMWDKLRGQPEFEALFQPVQK